MIEIADRTAFCDIRRCWREVVSKIPSAAPGDSAESPKEPSSRVLTFALSRSFEFDRLARLATKLFLKPLLGEAATRESSARHSKGGIPAWAHHTNNASTNLWKVSVAAIRASRSFIRQ